MPHRIQSFLRFLWCLYFALSLVGCAAPLSLQSLRALNQQAYAGRICGAPKGAPPNTRFFAVNVAMRKYVTDRNPDALREFMSVADSVHQVTTWAPASSAKTVPISMGVTCPARQDLPPDLLAQLNGIVSESCTTASKNRPNLRYVGQTWSDGREPLGEMRNRMLIAVLNWAVQHDDSAEKRAASPVLRQILPVPPMVVQGQSAKIDDESPLRLEDPVVQLAGGAASGAMIGGVPLGPMGADIAIELGLLPKGTYWARVGKACGEIVIGTGQIILGCAGMTSGAGMSSTGGGAAVGVPVIAGSYAIAVNGCATAGHGLAEAHQLWREGAPPDSPPPPPPSTVKLKPAPKKPTAQAPAIAAPQATAPPPGTLIVKTSPSGNVTKTRSRPPPGQKPPEITTTIQTNSTGNVTTTTRVKGKPSAAGAHAKPVAKGAKRGPKTDPDAPHNAAIRREADKLRAQGNEIIAGGGDAEKVVQIKGGIKRLRRPDIIYTTPDGKLRGRNVGKTNADGTPVKREVEALDDLNKDGKVPTDFVPYDR